MKSCLEVFASSALAWTVPSDATAVRKGREAVDLDCSKLAAISWIFTSVVWVAPTVIVAESGTTFSASSRDRSKDDPPQNSSETILNWSGETGVCSSALLFLPFLAKVLRLWDTFRVKLLRAVNWLKFRFKMLLCAFIHNFCLTCSLFHSLRKKELFTTSESKVTHAVYDKTI